MFYIPRFFKNFNGPKFEPNLSIKKVLRPYVDPFFSFDFRGPCMVYICGFFNVFSMTLLWFLFVDCKWILQKYCDPH